MSAQIFKRQFLAALFVLVMLGLVGSATAFAQGYGRSNWRERQRYEEMRMREMMREQRIREEMRREAYLRAMMREQHYREQMREARIQEGRERRMRDRIRDEYANRGEYGRPYRRF